MSFVNARKPTSSPTRPSVHAFRAGGASQRARPGRRRRARRDHGRRRAHAVARPSTARRPPADLGRGDLLGHRRIGRQVVGGPQERRLVGVLDGDLGDDPAAEDHDRPIAGELDLLELGGVEQDRGARRREVAQELRRSAAWSRCRCRASGRSRASSGRRRRPSARSSPSAGCRPTGAGPRTWRACRSGAVRSAPSTRRRSAPCVDRAPRPQRRGERQGDVLADRPLHQERLGAVGRDVDEAGPDRVGRVAERHRSRRRRASSPPSGPLGAGEDVEQLVLALPLERDDARGPRPDTGRTRRRAASCPSRRFVARIRGDARRPPAPLAPRPATGRAAMLLRDVAQHQRDDPLLGARVRRRRRRPSRPRAGRSRGRTRRAISISRWEMKMTRPVRAALPADDLEDALGQVGRQGGGHLVEHQDGRARSRARGRGR